MDEVHAVFESILDWSSFSVRIREDQLERIPEILKSITPTQVHKMQRHLTQVWHRFGYQTGDLMQAQARRYALLADQSHPFAESDLSHGYPIQRVQKYPVQDDAFSTIMQWLNSRIPATR
eukprot:gene9449-1687_t